MGRLFSEAADLLTMRIGPADGAKTVDPSRR
jgi:hypothetical protein